MRTQVSEESPASGGYALLLFLFWALIWGSLLSGCVSWPAIRSYAAEKTAQLAQCQAQDITSAETARACLGVYARDLGTQGCREAEAWLETLTSEDDTAGAPGEGS